MQTAIAIRERIYELMKEKKLNKYQLIYKTGIAPSTLKSVLNGKSRNPGAKTITLICTGLDVTVREFYNSDLFDDWMMAEDDEEEYSL